MTDGAGPDGQRTATVMFTDLVGSTPLRVQLGEDRADALRRQHDALLRDAINAHDGTVVKGGGDGVMALFHSATDALSAAEACQQAMARHNRHPESAAPLHVRIGLSVGDVRIEDGDCFGTPVVEAARLEAAAGGGQVLCSDLVRLMSRGRGDHVLRAAGPLTLKGLPEPVETYELVWREPPPMPASRPLPPELAVETVRPFVGRTAEITAAVALLERDDADRLAVLWLAGEPGIGKTRLAAQLAAACHARGARVLFGRCSEDLAVPYQPFVEAMRSYVAPLADSELGAALGPGAPMLGRLLGDLRRRDPALAPPEATTPETDRYNLFEAVRSWLQSASLERPLVLVIDDVHWAASATLRLLAHLARSAEPAKVTIVCTARDTAPEDTDELRHVVSDLHRFSRFELITVAGLDVEAVTELIGDEREAVRLVAETAGNPLFLDALRTGGTVDATVRRRLAGLDPDAAGLLTIASIIGLEFELAVLADAANVPFDGALDAVEQAAAAHIVQEVGPDEWAFTHALVRASLARSLSATRRGRLHRAIADAYARRQGADGDDVAIAHHMLAAGATAARRDTVDALVRAGDSAARQYAHGDALAWYERALPLADGADERSSVLLRLGREWVTVSNFAAAEQALEAACSDALAADALERAVDAALLFEEASWRPGRPGAAALGLVEQVLARIEEGPDRTSNAAARVALIAAKVRALHYAGRRADALRVATEALRTDLTPIPPLVRAHALHRLAYLYLQNPPHEALGDLSDEIWRIATAQADGLLQLVGSNLRYQLAIWRGDPDAAAAARADLTFAAQRIHDVFWNHVVAALEWGEKFDGGDLAEAERMAERAQSLHDAAQEQWLEPEGLYGLRMFFVRREQDRLGEVAPALRLLERPGSGTVVWRPGLALLLVELGRTHDAGEVLGQLGSNDFSSLPDDDNALLYRCFLAEVAYALSRPIEAASLESLLVPAAGRYSVLAGSGLRLGPIDRYLALCRATQGDLEGADRLLRGALELSQLMSAPLWTARVLADRGVVLGDRSSARAALDIAERLQLPAIARRAQRALASP